MEATVKCLELEVITQGEVTQTQKPNQNKEIKTMAYSSYSLMLTFNF